MQIDFRSKTFRLVVVTVIITVIITVCLLSLAAWKGINFFVDRTIDNVTNAVEETCLTDDQTYRGEVFFLYDLERRHREGRLYDRKLATILWDIGGAVASSNCKKSIPIPAPFKTYHVARGFNRDLVDLNGQGKYTMYGYIFHDPDQRLACIVFAGTYYQSQWRNNLKLALTPASGLNGSEPDTKIHRGFYSNYMAVRSILWEWWEQNQYEVDNLIITGRSLGGALSTICAFDFADLRGVQILHYSFASPRVGNVCFADSFNQRVKNSVRIYNTEDIVVDVPPAIFRHNVYKHVGEPQNSKVFTLNLGTLFENHIDAYRELPI